MKKTYILPIGFASAGLSAGIKNTKKNDLAIWSLGDLAIFIKF